MRKLYQNLLAAAVLAAFGGGLLGAEADAERDRKARVALALAGPGKPAIAAAPPPRVKAPTYPEGHARAVSDLRPLVVFVGTDLWPVRDAVVARADTFAGVEAPAVVVGYPVADRMWIHATIAGENVTTAGVQKAADDAGKKIADPPARAMPAPVPLTWDIRAGPKVLPCPCGDRCPCVGRDDLAKVRDSLVRVRSGDGQGSGTVIWSANGQSVVLTAAHVLTDGAALTVRGSGKTHTATVLAVDRSADLAALLVAVGLPAVRVTGSDPADGADVLLVGMTSLWSRGKIEGRKQFAGGEQYLLGGGYESDSGDSGGGVFVAGELCGVHCGKAGDSPTSTRTPYAAGVKPVRAFLATVFRRDGARFVPVVSGGRKPPVEPTTAVPAMAGVITTTSGRQIRPNGRGGWEYVGDPGFAPPAYLPAAPFNPACPNGRCPLK